ncbi:MAG: ribose 5-phosphate isomerase B [Saprospiraceae bacterium]|nr:ribose 5-phosphate isomerase B [Candidatus Vicinibacter affinis]MBP6173092.1 ribose 5-phosphate isomerase B [Saprospiraceae bacterium]MBK6573286.1 ribose 5-phosphate isomerase B [Candidatus Vicinibacter affinis]MBK6822241.1 ribose 5-phosphate isomerase B [Candidatus Vicinibacter affinis]MBK7301969.1 ribose 5-phosphate isomerase B [Candidatus Vicinibacter affinis]
MSRVIAIGSDHAGFDLKNLLIKNLESKGYKVMDQGCFDMESVDYPDFGHLVSAAILNHVAELGIVICGSGNGIAMSANRHPGIRCALCWTPEIASLARSHNDANILSLPARFIDEQVALSIVETFLLKDFEGGRHQRRVDKIEIA